jgi:hypothetical protein
MATLDGQIQALATQLGTDIKQIITNQGDLSALTTTQKASLVLAINELKAELGTIDADLIDDSAPSSTKTYSSSKIVSEIQTKCQEVKDALLGGAGEAFDTLKELADLIEQNKDLIESLQTLAGSHVRYDAAQELSPQQKTQARSNIGAADDTDYQATKTAVGTVANLQTTEKTNLVGAVNEVLGVANTAKTTAEGAQTKASQVESNLSTFKTNVGATDTDFVAIYVAARDGTSEG